MSECGSYWLVSLLNTDLKLFTKLLASRIQPQLFQLIHLDQAGFIPSREVRDNTFKVLNLVQHAKKTKTPCVFLSTGAEKVFDGVNWTFMFEVLKHMGLGDQILQWFARVYSSPQASVKANGVYSKPFSIPNCTLQGCPLSPLLFAISLEPSLNKIRQNPDIMGLKIGGHNYKCQPMQTTYFSHVSLTNLMREIEGYRALSNFKINYAKSEAMGVVLPCSVRSILHLNFKSIWTSTALKY